MPYVHRLWDVLIKRFSIDFEHPVVIKRAFDCLMLASEFCGDFLLRRTKTEVLPFLIKFLNSCFNRRVNCYCRHQRKETIKSVEYYAEYELLQSIGQLAVNIKLSVLKDISGLLSILLFYICSKSIVPELQKCAFESIITIGENLDHYSVRFHVHQFLHLFYNQNSNLLKYPKQFHHCNCDRNYQQLNRKQIEKTSFMPLEQCLLNDLVSYLNQ